MPHSISGDLVDLIQNPQTVYQELMQQLSFIMGKELLFGDRAYDSMALHLFDQNGKESHTRKCKKYINVYIEQYCIKCDYSSFLPNIVHHTYNDL